MKDLEKQFKALANRRRLAIIKFLKGTREATVTDIADHIKLSIRSTSKHLAVLSAQDVVDKEQRSLLVYYRIALSQKHIIAKILPHI
jgi:DNA-binding transcriptional ArsR family regulator